MPIKIIRNSITLNELIEMIREEFEGLVKAVVDIKQEIMAVGGDFHADMEVVLTEQENSKREHTWGINLYPKEEDMFNAIEFDSMINIKPAFGNRSRGVENEEIRNKIKEIVKKLVVI